MFKQNKWQAWYESQPQHIKDWMDQPQAIWYDSDMWKAGLFGVFVGVLIGLAVQIIHGILSFRMSSIDYSILLLLP